MAERVLTAEVLLRATVTPEQERFLAELLDEAGYPPLVRRTRAHREPVDLTWIALVALPLQAFLSGLGTEVLGSAYRGIKRFVRGGSDGPEPALPAPMVLQDTVSGIRVVLDAGLPPEAFEKLLRLDLSAYRSGPVHYDVARARWRSVQDEAAQA
ncbi:hypothetical protein [Streptomyces beijiangensis]|uniref:Uncharacterized protein n=1 Tax=Streptomyces beijiangensis TaxID=163361 RepID=A0A939JHS9_9ACTN|nr:hypothetical protein [Streptomyces beijiangensis]MBO0512957.1 hypothetical protein [Streptomyces beijiangensis]